MQVCQLLGGGTVSMAHTDLSESAVVEHCYLIYMLYSTQPVSNVQHCVIWGEGEKEEEEDHNYHFMARQISFLAWQALSKSFCTSFSDCASRALVASFRISTPGFLRKALIQLAIAILCVCVCMCLCAISHWLSSTSLHCIYTYMYIHTSYAAFVSVPPKTA